jgi:hypothetical protein
MPLAYLLTTVLFTAIAALIAVDASLVSLNLLGAYPALRWVRVHFITLGILSQVIFGALPGLVAMLSGRLRPRMRWDIWLSLNAGFVLLVAGFAGVNQAMILAGGTLIFTAATLFVIQLLQLRGSEAPSSLKFYITSVAFLLLGIIVGTGLWLNWGETLRIAVPLEVHVHANMYGFMSMAFGGLLVDLIPRLTGKPIGSLRTITAIYWGMSLGALLLVIGPWIGGTHVPTSAGLVLHLASDAWLAYLMLRALRAGGRLGEAGAWHLIAAYSWILLPTVAVPLMLWNMLDPSTVESIAPQGLIYGWVLQFGIAVVPYLGRRLALKQTGPRLGGNWLSLGSATLGSILVWLSILIAPVRGLLYGVGFAFLAVALIPLILELVGIAGERLERTESDG